jgi:hypothetical protein
MDMQQITANAEFRSDVDLDGFPVKENTETVVFSLFIFI